MRFFQNRLAKYFPVRNINSVVKFLTVSDFLILSGFGLISPIFAIFVTESVVGGTVQVAGIASAIYLLTRSVFQVPVAALLDKIVGERDDFWTLFVGSVVFSVVPLLYLAVSTPTHLYIIQFLYGLSVAVTYPSWYAIFTRHIDKNHEGVEWGAYNTLVDLGSAGAAALGSFLVVQFGFNLVFVLVSGISLVGSFFLLGIYKELKIKR
jgi:MFS family permease